MIYSSLTLNDVSYGASRGNGICFTMVVISACSQRTHSPFDLLARLQPPAYIAVICFVLFLLMVGCTDTARPPLTGDLPVTAPVAVHAGESIQVVVGPVEVDNGTPIGMVSVGAFGPRVYNTVFSAGMAAFTIPSEHTLQPGYLALIVAVESARGEASIILIPSRTTSTRRAGTINLVHD